MRGASRPLTADSAGATYRFDADFIYLTRILSIYRIFIQVAFCNLITLNQPETVGIPYIRELLSSRAFYVFGRDYD